MKPILCIASAVVACTLVLASIAGAATISSRQMSQPMTQGLLFQSPGIVNGDPSWCDMREAYNACKRGCQKGGDNRSAYSTCRMLCEKMFCT